jgi:hypothetical protein
MNVKRVESQNIHFNTAKCRGTVPQHFAALKPGGLPPPML